MSTALDEALLADARRVIGGQPDAVLIDVHCVSSRSCCVELMNQPRRGEVWWCEPPHIGRRAAVVLSRDRA